MNPTSNSKTRLWILGAAIVLVGAGVYVTATYSKNKESQASAQGRSPDALSTKGPAEAAVFEVTTQRFVNVLDGLVGTVKGETVQLAFGGQDEKLTAIHARLGQKVKKGTVLFELDHTRAAARKDQAEAAYQRMKSLQSAGGATAQDVTEARAAYDVAMKDFQDTYIVAPKDGSLSEISKQVGETIGRGEMVGVFVSSQDPLVVETGVIEGQLDQVTENQRVIVRIDAIGVDFEGRVAGVSREVTTTGRTGTVIVSLPASARAQLRPGLSARCTLILVDEPSALVIPSAAYSADLQGVMFVNSDNIAKLKPITLGPRQRDYYIVKEGLVSGDRVVANLTMTPVTNDQTVTISETRKYDEPLPTGLE